MSKEHEQDWEAAPVSVDQEQPTVLSTASSVLKEEEQQQRLLLQELAAFLADSTKDGLFPLVAYSVTQDWVSILTTNIPDLPFAIRILAVVNRTGYNLGYSLRPEVIKRLANSNPHVFRLFERQLPRVHEVKLRRLGRVVSTFGAPFYEQKGFALLDMCGFSRLDNPSQLSQLYSLTNAIDSSIKRCYNVCQRLRLPNRFGRTSTGDGFYLWHDFIGGNADVATLFLLICVMTQSEAMRDAGFPMRLRGGFVVDSSYMFYEADARMDPHAVASNAVGAATNKAARLVSAAKPSQVLIGAFSRPGQADEKMDPSTMLAQVNELFREEGFGAAALELQPKTHLRIEDKHGDIHYCWNVVGNVPNQVGNRATRVAIGLEPDSATPIDQVKFVRC